MTKLTISICLIQSRRKSMAVIPERISLEINNNFVGLEVQTHKPVHTLTGFLRIRENALYASHRRYLHSIRLSIETNFFDTDKDVLIRRCRHNPGTWKRVEIVMNAVAWWRHRYVWARFYCVTLNRRTLWNKLTGGRTITKGKKRRRILKIQRIKAVLQKKNCHDWAKYREAERKQTIEHRTEKAKHWKKKYKLEKERGVIGRLERGGWRRLHFNTLLSKQQQQQQHNTKPLYIFPRGVEPLMPGKKLSFVGLNAR